MAIYILSALPSPSLPELAATTLYIIKSVYSCGGRQPPLPTAREELPHPLAPTPNWLGPATRGGPSPTYNSRHWLQCLPI